MRKGVWQVEKERCLLVGFYEADRLLGIAFRQCTLVSRCFDYRFILNNRHGRVPAIGLLHIIGIGNSIVFIEPVAGGEMFRLVPQMPFPNTGGGVAFCLECFGKGELVGI